MLAVIAVKCLSDLLTRMLRHMKAYVDKEIMLMTILHNLLTFGIFTCDGKTISFNSEY